MALDLSGGYVAPNNLTELSESSLPIFDVQPVQLHFAVAANFVAAQVANNVLVLALATGRILRIDLDSPADIDGETATARSLDDDLLLMFQCMTQISIFQRSLQR
jgi:hypothetical protein